MFLEIIAGYTPTQRLGA